MNVILSFDFEIRNLQLSRSDNYELFFKCAISSCPTYFNIVQLRSEFIASKGVYIL